MRDDREGIGVLEGLAFLGLLLGTFWAGYVVGRMPPGESLVVTVAHERRDKTTAPATGATLEAEP